MLPVLRLELTAVNPKSIGVPQRLPYNDTDPQQSQPSGRSAYLMSLVPLQKLSETPPEAPTRRLDWREGREGRVGYIIFFVLVYCHYNKRVVESVLSYQERLL